MRLGILSLGGAICLPAVLTCVPRIVVVRDAPRQEEQPSEQAETNQQAERNAPTEDPPPGQEQGKREKRSSQRRGRNFNVKDYGAQGNGRTDETAAIQAALDAAREAGGGKVYLPAGTYLVRAAIDAPTLTQVVFNVGNNTEIAGDGASSIVKIQGGKYNAIFYSEGGENLTFHDFRVDQNPTGNAANPVGTGDDNSQRVIYVAKYKNLRIQRVRFEPACGIWAVFALDPKGDQLLIEDCTFRFVNGRVAKKGAEKDYDVSVIYAQGTHVLIQNNVLKSNPSEYARTAIEAQGNDVLIQKNTVDYFSCGVIVTNGILPKDAEETGPVIVDNNQFLHMVQGVALWASTHRTLRNVKITNNVITISRRDWSWTPEYYGIIHVLYTGETSEADPDTYQGNVSDSVISGNTITFLDVPPDYVNNRGSVSAGISFASDGNARGLVISNNQIIDPPMIGISLGNSITKSTLSNVRVENNVIVNAGWSEAAEREYRAAVKLGARLNGIQLLNNKIKHTGSRGAGVYSFWAHPSSAKDVVLKNNTVESRADLAADLAPTISTEK